MCVGVQYQRFVSFGYYVEHVLRVKFLDDVGSFRVVHPLIGKKKGLAEEA